MNHEIVEKFIIEMYHTTPDEREMIKLVLLNGNKDKPAVFGFLNAVFNLIETLSPKMIEMKLK